MSTAENLPMKGGPKAALKRTHSPALRDWRGLPMCHRDREAFGVRRVYRRSGPARPAQVHDPDARPTLEIAGSHGRSGITLLEVMILLAAMAVLAFVFLPRLVQMRSMGEQAKRIQCFSHLRQIGLSYLQWAYDHHDQFPMSLAMTNGGTMDHPFAYEPWVHYQKLSNELNTPIVLVCPADRRMREAASFATGFGNSNVSYFVGLEVEQTRPNMLLAGDRNLASNNVALSPGLYAVDTNATHGWTKQLHRLKGNVALADGSVQQSSQTRLQQWLVESPNTNRLAVP